MGTPRVKRPCKVVVDMTGKECGRASVSKATVHLPGVTVAHVDVCNLHNSILNESAASKRVAGKK